tara:strand:- start:1235 stop:2410 length:1176 start_codon:yes stop_codon:yes gene_type:complete
MTKKNLLVIGATGFVGRRFCQYLLDQNYDKKLNLKFSARNKDKFKKVFSSELGDRFEFRELDTLNNYQVKEVLKDVQFVANFAGPYDLYAKDVVSFCAKNGIDYFDITGEFPFIKKMIDLHHDEALASKAKIIHCCGFDSVPSEVAAIKSAEVFHAKFKKFPQEVSSIFQLKGGFNGGTLYSASNILKTVKPKEFNNLTYLCNTASRYVAQSTTRKFQYKNINASPFFMESINSKIIFRGFEQLGLKEVLTSSVYREYFTLFKSSPLFLQKAITGGLYGFNKLLTTKGGKKLVGILGPKPGEGPNEKQIKEGFFKATSICHINGKEVPTIEISGTGDPGNIVTVNCMLSVLDCLIEEANQEVGGFLTPYATYKEKLIQNLKNHQITLKVLL